MTYNYEENPTAGMVLENRDERLILTDMNPGAPGHRIRCWRSRIRHAWLVEIDGVKVTTVDDVTTILREAVLTGKRKCILLFAQPEI